MSELNITRVPQFLDPWFTEIEQVWDEIEASVNDIEARVEALESGPSAEWGSITGTLADQTDVQSALNAKQATLSGASLTAVTPATNDKILIQDTSDSSNLKTVTTQAVANLVDNSTVISKVLTGLSAGAGTVAATDTILQAFNKIVGNQAAVIPIVTSIAKVTDTTLGTSQVGIPGLSVDFTLAYAQKVFVSYNGRVTWSGTDDVILFGFYVDGVSVGVSNTLVHILNFISFGEWTDTLAPGPHTIQLWIYGGSFANTLNGSNTSVANKLEVAQYPQGAFSFSNPMTTGGDIMAGGALGSPTRIANGSSGNLLTSQGGTSLPVWAAPASSQPRLITSATLAATFFNVVASSADAPGGGMAAVTNLVCSITTTKANEIILLTYPCEFSFSSSGGAFLGYQIDSNTPVCLSYARAGSAGTFSTVTTISKYITIATPGTYDIKIAASLVTGSAFIDRFVGGGTGTEEIKMEVIQFA